MTQSAINPRAATFTPQSTPKASFTTPLSEDVHSDYDYLNPTCIYNASVFPGDWAEHESTYNGSTIPTNPYYKQFSYPTPASTPWARMEERSQFNFQPQGITYDPFCYTLPFSMPLIAPAAHYDLPICPSSYIDHPHLMPAKNWQVQPYANSYGLDCGGFEIQQDLHDAESRVHPSETHVASADVSPNSSEGTTPRLTYALVASKEAVTSPDRGVQNRFSRKDISPESAKRANRQGRVRSSSPPPNAPKAPLAIELAGWTQSKSWSSKERTEMMTFQRMKRNFRYIQAENSPFLPQTPSELSSLKAAMAKEWLQRISQKIQNTTKNCDNSDAKDDGLADTVVVEFCNGRYPKEGSASLFQGQTYFSEGAVFQPQQARWPTVSELKDPVGTANCPRSLPFPKGGFLDTEMDLGRSLSSSDFALGHILPVDSAFLADAYDEDDDTCLCSIPYRIKELILFIDEN